MVVKIGKLSKRPLSRASIDVIVKRYAVMAGITKRVYPHLLLHTHGTIARKKGLPLDAIAKQLGHDDISTTQLYAQLADDQFEKEYEKFYCHPIHPTRELPNDVDPAYR